MTASSASAIVPPCSSSVSSPEDVCILRTTSTIWSIDSGGGLMSTSTPSPSTLSSKSVTSAATSTSASSVMLSPVISQSIHTRRSFMRLTLEVGTVSRSILGARRGLGLGRRLAEEAAATHDEERDRPENEEREADEGSLAPADAGPGESDDGDHD